MPDSLKNPKPLAPAPSAPSGGQKVKNASAAPSANTKSVAKKNTAAGDPASMAKPSRSNVPGNSGARYGVRVKMGGGTAPEAGQVLAAGRLFSSAVNRTSPNFQGGVDSAYQG